MVILLFCLVVRVEGILISYGNLKKEFGKKWIQQDKYLLVGTFFHPSSTPLGLRVALFFARVLAPGASTVTFFFIQLYALCLVFILLLVRYGHSAVLHDKKMFIFGGYDNVLGINNDLFMFDFLKSTWETITLPKGSQRPQSRHSHFVQMISTKKENAFYVFGGTFGLSPSLFLLRCGCVDGGSPFSTTRFPTPIAWGPQQMFVNLQIHNELSSPLHPVCTNHSSCGIFPRQPVSVEAC